MIIISTDYGFAVHNDMIFIETSTFTKLLPRYLDEDDYRSLQNYLQLHPEAGMIIKGSGGIRKVRWSVRGRGKSGGLRVIYYFKKKYSQIWMLTIYAKAEIANIPGYKLKHIAEAIDHEKT